MSLLGKMAELDLLAAAKSSDDDQSRLQYCQAWYYSGLKQLLSGNQNWLEISSLNAWRPNKTPYDEYGCTKLESKELGVAPPQ